MKARPPESERCAADTICPAWCPDRRCHFRGRFQYRGRRYCRKHRAIVAREAWRHTTCDCRRDTTAELDAWWAACSDAMLVPTGRSGG